ncbi:MAG: M20 family metallopeptidase, partial [Granulosicoccus sp.]
RKALLDAASRYFDSGGFEQELARRVSIRTESQKPDNVGILRSYLVDEMVPVFRDMGFTHQLFENPVAGCGPVLLARRVEDARLPTVLGYGHGDVILGQDDQWSHGAGPWQLTRDGERWYGRGTADNKAQHTINMAALRCVLSQRGRLGFNALFIIETGEEVGSPGLRAIVESNMEHFRADVLIASDGPRVSPEKTTLTLGSRGSINFDLVVALRDGAHHSGNWGGLIADPAIILSNAIASIVNARGQIAISDWLPPPTNDAVKSALRGVQIAAGEDAPQIDEHWGQPGLTSAEKVYAWNSFAVLAMKSGNPENPVNAIAPFARAHCQLRYFAGTDENQILPALREHLDRQGFSNVSIDAHPHSNSARFTASRTEPNHPWVEFADSSVRRTNGEAPVLLPSMGGSICNDLFTHVLGIPAIWVPHSYAGCSQHAPDEHVLAPLCRNALQVMAGLYWDIGQANAHAETKG